MIAKIFQALLGILLLPFCVGYSIAFYDHLLTLRRVNGPEIALLLGITAYLAGHTIVGSPSRVYVFGHELTHAVAAWISGGQVKSFKVGKNSGAVITDKINAVVALAPYMIPAYTILWTFAYGIAGFFWDVKKWIYTFFFGLGATLAFHWVFTIDALKQKQSDLDLLGPILSLVLIYWFNIALVIGVMSLIVPDIRLLIYFKDGYHHSLDLYYLIVRQLFSI